MKIPFSILSNKVKKTVLFGGSPKPLAKSFSNLFDKKTTYEKHMKNLYELNKTKVNKNNYLLILMM